MKVSLYFLNYWKIIILIHLLVQHISLPPPWYLHSLFMSLGYVVTTLKKKKSFTSTFLVVLLWKRNLYLIFFRCKQLQSNQVFYHVNMAFLRCQKKWLFTFLENRKKNNVTESKNTLLPVTRYLACTYAYLHKNLYVVCLGKSTKCRYIQEE